MHVSSCVKYMPQTATLLKPHQSNRRYYVKIVPKPGSERILEPVWRALLRIHFWWLLWSGIFDHHLLFDLIFYFSGRGVVRSQIKIEYVIFRAIWYPGLICQGPGRLIVRVFLQFHDLKAHINYIDVVAGSQVVTDSGRQWQVAAGSGRWR